MKRKALFVTYGGGHIAMVLPVMRALRQQDPGIDCTLMALTTAQSRAVAAGEPYVSFKDFLHLVDARAARTWGERLHPANRSPDVSDAESVAYLGINYLDLLERLGEDGAAALYAQKGRYGFFPLHFMRKVLHEIAPDIVVATNSPRGEEAALQAAVERGIPSVGMIDMFGLDSDPYVSRTMRPNLTCVIHEVVRQRLLARGFARESVAVTGNPAFDGLSSPANLAAARSYLSERGWVGLKVILWAGFVEPYSHPGSLVPAGHALALEVEEALRSMVAAREDMALVVRYHPSEWHTFPPHRPQARVHFSVPSAEPIHPVILASDAVVVQNSTVGLESAVAGKPVVSIESSPSVLATFSMAAQQVSVPCPSAADLRTVLTGVLAAGAGKPTMYRSDGRAAQRVARCILGQLR